MLQFVCSCSLLCYACRSSNGGHQLDILLTPDEASDVLNFVLKDDATNTWYDNNGSNFTVPLRTDMVSCPAPQPADSLPKTLCDKWAWVRWDFQGRPSRSEQTAAVEYERGVQEMKQLLAKGRSIDELWRVAESKWKYNDYREKIVVPVAGAAYAAAPATAPQQLGPPPQDLVNVQAYVLWEHAGKPQGADFGNDARVKIEEEVRKGLTYEQIAAKLNFFPDWMKATNGDGRAPAAPAPASAPPPVAAPAPVRAPAPSPPPQQPQAQVGQSLGTPKRNPLDMIKVSWDSANFSSMITLCLMAGHIAPCR